MANTGGDQYFGFDARFNHVFASTESLPYSHSMVPGGFDVTS